MFLFLEMFLVFQIDRGNLIVMFTKRHKYQRKIDAMKILTLFFQMSNPRQEALLYVFEDNEVVIKMIIKGRSPTKRHVSRTHRVAFD